MEIQQQQLATNNSSTLPIHQYKSKILQQIQSNSVTIICGQTGSGKTTQIPQFLYANYPSILISQPRRISAITLAQRVAKEMQVEIGVEVGYSVRFEEKRCAKTRVTFMTDGMAIRELMVGRQFDVFVIDEAHQRSINTDVLLAVLKRLLAVKKQSNAKFSLKKNFKLVIMSATINASKFMSFFQTNSLITIQGRSFPTKIFNLLDPTENYLQGCFNCALQIHYKQSQGDILVFLTGQDEIVGLSKRLQKAKQQYSIGNLQILMLYSALPHEYQHQIFEPSKQTPKPRRIILSTNIAETSVTIPGVRYVVDCGYMKIRLYDNHKLLDMLTVVPISKANALQRAGRAGRESQGKCFRLFLQNSYDQLEEEANPEILRSQLTGPLLQLKAIGIPQIQMLKFLDQPPKAVITQCLQILRQIKCLTSQQQITQYGKEISTLPLPPRQAHLLLLSIVHKCEGLVLSLVSILSIENFFLSSAFSEKGNKKGTAYQIMAKYLPTLDVTYLASSSFAKSGLKASSNRLLTSDHLSKINILHEYVKCPNQANFCKQNHLNRNNIKRAVQIRQQLQKYLLDINKERQKKEFIPLTTTQSKKNTSKTSIENSVITSSSVADWIRCMEKGCHYLTAKLNKDGKYVINRSGQIAQIHPQSLCFYLPQKPQCIVFSQVVKTTKIYMKDITPLPNKI